MHVEIKHKIIWGHFAKHLQHPELCLCGRTRRHVHGQAVRPYAVTSWSSLNHAWSIKVPLLTLLSIGSPGHLIFSSSVVTGASAPEAGHRPKHSLHRNLFKKKGKQMAAQKNGEVLKKRVARAEMGGADVVIYSFATCHRLWRMRAESQSSWWLLQRACSSHWKPCPLKRDPQPEISKRNERICSHTKSCQMSESDKATMATKQNRKQLNENPPAP